MKLTSFHAESKLSSDLDLLQVSISLVKCVIISEAERSLLMLLAFSGAFQIQMNIPVTSSSDVSSVFLISPP